MGVGRRSLRTERVSRFERGEQLASGGASISLRVGRVSRFGRGVLLASGGACFSLRAGRVSRFGRGVLLASGGADRMYWFYRYNLVCCPRRTVKLGFTDIVLFSVRLCLENRVISKMYVRCRKCWKALFRVCGMSRQC